MARDRQRAKRRQRRAAQNPGSATGRPKPLHRENVPGELDHASGQVDQFEAALVAGAEGVQADEPAEALVEPEAGVEPEAEAEPQAAGPIEAEAEAEAEFEDEELYEDEAQDGETAGELAAATPATAAKRKRSRSSIANFLRASWAELQRVQWPDRRQVGQATAVVLGFVVIAGVYLGLADAVAQEIVNVIL